MRGGVLYIQAAICRLGQSVARVRWFGVLMLAVLLVDCGGGGGGSDKSLSPLEYTVSSGGLFFYGKQGDPAPKSQDITITITSGGPGHVSVGQQSASFFSWAYASQGSVSTVIRVTPQNPTTAGEFNATLPVQICRDSACTAIEATVLLNIRYSVAPEYVLQSYPISTDFDTSPDLSPAEQTLRLSLSNGADYSWSRSVTYTAGSPGWLTVSPASGASLNAAATLHANANGMPVGRHTAVVTFTAGDGTATVPVSLTVHAPAVNFVAPYVANTASASEVVLRGHGFSTIVGTLQVRFGATGASSARMLSDTEIRATPPVLPAGSHVVTVGDAAVTLPTRARLLVLDPQPYSYAALTRPAGADVVGSLIYDAERRAIYLIDGNSGRMEAYRFNGTGWASSTPVMVGDFGNNPRIALSTDGAELIKTAGARLWHIDPATLAATGSVDATQGLNSPLLLTNMIAFANDGHAIGNASAGGVQVHLYRYNMLTRQFAVIPTPFEGTQPDMVNRYIVASGNGATLLMPTFDSWPISTRPLYRYDASTYSASQAGISTGTTGMTSLDRQGSRGIIMSEGAARVYLIGNMGLIGTLADPTQNLKSFAISPNGDRAYVYYDNGTLRTFDLSLPVSGGFAEVGAPRTLADAPGTYSRMTISPDGGTLVIAGSQRVLVIPVH